MCLAIPGRIVSIDRDVPDLKMATVEFGGMTQKICVQWVDAVVGDYVLAHAGMAISRVDTVETGKTLAAFENIARSLGDETPR